MKDQFDIEEPNAGHEQRFLEKLKQGNTIVENKRSTRSIWRPFIGIAASIALIVSLVVGLQSNDDLKDLASVSPEMEETQNFFTVAIASEVQKLKQQTSPQFDHLINDALTQIEILEQQYSNLKLDLTESGEDKRVIYAMISNFQQRIEILKNLLDQMEYLEQIKSTKNEEYI